MAYFFKFIVSLIAFSSLSAAYSSDLKMPVMVGIDENTDACTAQGVVTGLKNNGDGFLAVRAGAGRHYPLIDKLQQGQAVFICNISVDNKWLGIVYDSTASLDCGVSSPITHAQPYQGKCRSGWVNRRWLKIVAG